MDSRPTTHDKTGQNANACSSINIIELVNSTTDNDKQDLKAPNLIVVTVGGKESERSEEHSENANCPIETSPFEIVAVASLVQNRNA